MYHHFTTCSYGAERRVLKGADPVGISVPSGEEAVRYLFLCSIFGRALTLEKPHVGKGSKRAAALFCHCRIATAVLLMLQVVMTVDCSS